MTNRTHAGFLLLVLAVGLAGCNGASTPSPTAPAAVTPGSGWRDVKINGDTRFDIELVRR
jgi:hypothetical protein